MKRISILAAAALCAALCRPLSAADAAADAAKDTKAADAAKAAADAAKLAETRAQRMVKGAVNLFEQKISRGKMLGKRIGIIWDNLLRRSSSTLLVTE